MKVPEEFRHMVGCTLCPLHKTRMNVVVGIGSLTDAKYLLIGEAPGENEDESGRPFVGRAGSKLWEIVEKVGLSKKDFYITNIVKCRPPENRRPTSFEKKACSGHLKLQLATVVHKLVIVAGNTALQHFFPDKKIMTSRGKVVVTKTGVKVYPIIHPSACLRRPEWEELLEEDLARLAGERLIVESDGVSMFSVKSIRRR